MSETQFWQGDSCFVVYLLSMGVIIEQVSLGNLRNRSAVQVL